MADTKSSQSVEPYMTAHSQSQKVRDFYARSQSLEEEEKQLQARIEVIRKLRANHHQESRLAKNRSLQQLILDALDKDDYENMRKEYLKSLPIEKNANTHLRAIVDGKATPEQCQTLQAVIMKVINPFADDQPILLPRVAAELEHMVGKSMMTRQDVREPIHGSKLTTETNEDKVVAKETSTTAEDSVPLTSVEGRPSARQTSIPVNAKESLISLQARQPSTPVRKVKTSLMGMTDGASSARKEDIVDNGNHPMDLNVALAAAVTSTTTANDNMSVNNYNSKLMNIQREEANDTINATPMSSKRQKLTVTESKKVDEPKHEYSSIGAPLNPDVILPASNSAEYMPHSGSAADSERKKRTLDTANEPADPAIESKPATDNQTPRKKKNFPMHRKFFNRVKKLADEDEELWQFELDCQKCKDIPVEARLSNCAHLYCSKCLSKIRKSAHRRGEEARCVTCDELVGAKCTAVNDKSVKSWRIHFELDPPDITLSDPSDIFESDDDMLEPGSPPLGLECELLLARQSRREL